MNSIADTIESEREEPSASDELAALEARLAALKTERAALEAELGQLEQAAGVARLYGRPVDKKSSSRCAAIRAELMAIDQAAVLAVGERERLERQRAAERAAAADAARLDAHERLAIAFAEAVEPLDQLLALGIAATEPNPDFAATFFHELGRAFRAQVDDVNRGRRSGRTVAPALEKLASEWRARAEKMRAPSPAPRLVALAWTVAVYARRRFIWGERDVEHDVPAGCIVLVPDVVAQRLAALDAIEVLAGPEVGVRVDLKRPWPVAAGGSIAPGERLVDAQIAEAMIAAGAAEPLRRLLPAEAAHWRRGRPEDRPFGPPIRLGRVELDESHEREAAAAAA